MIRIIIIAGIVCVLAVAARQSQSPPPPAVKTLTRAIVPDEAVHSHGGNEAWAYMPETGEWWHYMKDRFGYWYTDGQSDRPPDSARMLAE